MSHIFIYFLSLEILKPQNISHSKEKRLPALLLEVRYVKDMNVYIVTALISLFAYLWLGAPEARRKMAHR